MPGLIVRDDDGPSPRYKLSGTWDKPHPRLLRVTKLPVSQWTEKYKKHLGQMRNPKEKQGKRNVVAPLPTIEVLSQSPSARIPICPLFPRVEGLIAYRLCVQDYVEFHTELTVCFVVCLTDASAKWGDKEIKDRFKLAK